MTQGTCGSTKATVRQKGLDLSSMNERTPARSCAAVGLRTQFGSKPGTGLNGKEAAGLTCSLPAMPTR